jgi:hypothetical protein
LGIGIEDEAASIGNEAEAAGIGISAFIILS